MDFTEKTVESNLRFKGRVFTVLEDKIELPGGHHASRELIRHPGGVCVAALTAENELIFVRQFRYPYAKVLLELPAGKLERGEEPLHCAIRELREETGAAADTVESLGQIYPSPGYTDEILHLFLATGLHYGDAQPDEDEFLTCERIPLADAAEMTLRGEICDAKTAVAVLKLWAKRRD